MIKKISGNKPVLIHLTLVDVLLILLSLLWVYETNHFENGNHFYPFVRVEFLFMTYWFFRFLFSLNPKFTSFLLFSFLIALCTHELFSGYSQLLRNWGTNKAQDFCTGSFSNSGPFGCFLSVCTILFVTVWVKSHVTIIRVLMALIALVSFMLMVCILSRAALFSFAISLFVLALKNVKAKILVRKYGVYIALAVILIGTGTYLVKKPSADGRYLVARICLNMIKNGGLTGVGLGNFEGKYGEAQSVYFSHYLSDYSDFAEIDKTLEKMRMVADCPKYAFNEYLQLGVESGPIAMIIVVIMIMTGITDSYKKDNCWCYPLIAIASFSCFSYPLQVDLLLFLFTVFLASNTSKKELCGFDSFFYALMIMTIVCVFDSHNRDMIKKDSKNWPARFEDLCKNRTKLYRVSNSVIQDGLYDEFALFTYGKSLNSQKQYAKSDSVLALGIQISSDPMFWNVMGNNSLALGNYREAEERYKHAFYMVPNRLYPLYLLAKLYNTEGDSARFLKMADLVEEFVPKIESPKTERLRSEIREIKTTYQK